MYPLSPYNRRRLSVNLIGIGSTLIVCSLILLLSNWQHNTSSLIFRGAVERADCYITSETGRRGKGWYNSATYNKSNLNVVLRGVNKAFTVRENIGTAGHYEPFDKLKKNILCNDSLYISVDADNQNEYAPRVIEIKNNKGETLYLLPDKTSDNLKMFLLITGIGVILICTGSIYFLPLAVKRKIGF